MPTSSSDSTDTTSSRNATTTTARSVTTPSIPGGAPDVPNIGNVQKCAQLAAGYGSLFVPLAGGASDAQIQQAVDQLETMKGDVPDNIKADIDLIETGLNSAKPRA